MNAQVDPVPPTDESREPAGPAPVADPDKPGLGARIFEWFWGSRAMANVRATSHTTSARALELRRRAGAAIELGNMAAEPPRPLVYGPEYDIACELYREAICWALMAWQAGTAAAASAPSGVAAAEKKEAGAQKKDAEEDDASKVAVAPVELTALWEGADRQLLVKIAGTEEGADLVRRGIEGKGFADFPEIKAKELPVLARRLGTFAEGLLDGLDDAQTELQRIWIRRVFTVGLGLAIVVGTVLGASRLLDVHERSRDLALNKPWTASSHYPEYGCTSPLQDCPDSPDYFFHTKDEDDPWLIVDLQSNQKVSGIRVTNRLDCCMDRVAPLVVEVSTDKQNWKEVARNTSEFRTWKTSFPTAEGRYVKLHVPRHSMLHLREVRILK